MSFPTQTIHILWPKCMQFGFYIGKYKFATKRCLFVCCMGKAVWLIWGPFFSKYKNRTGILDWNLILEDRKKKKKADVSDVSLEKSYKDACESLFHMKWGKENSLFYEVNNWKKSGTNLETFISVLYISGMNNSALGCNISLPSPLQHPPALPLQLSWMRHDLMISRVPWFLQVQLLQGLGAASPSLEWIVMVFVVP